jgi:2-polyprenyl-6-methoxyphenol hydroxylase-like FAD-dependent oxidoreductase
MTSWKDEQVPIVGGGIGGLTAALALARQGIASQVIEQAAEFKEIGASIQLGPNVFWMLESLGLVEPISALAVFPENLVMLDSITGEEVTRVPLGEAFRRKFHHPYALIHRADLHNGCSASAANPTASGSMPRRKSSRWKRRARAMAGMEWLYGEQKELTRQAAAVPVH